MTSFLTVYVVFQMVVMSALGLCTGKLTLVNALRSDPLSSWALVLHQGNFEEFVVRASALKNMRTKVLTTKQMIAY